MAGTAAGLRSTRHTSGQHSLLFSLAAVRRARSAGKRGTPNLPQRLNQALPILPGSAGQPECRERSPWLVLPICVPCMEWEGKVPEHRAGSSSPAKSSKAQGLVQVRVWSRQSCYMVGET